MTAALLDLSAGRPARYGLIRQVYQAGLVNQALGGPFVAPWDVDELPGDLLDAILALQTGLPRLREGRQQVEEIFAKWRTENRVH